MSRPVAAPPFAGLARALRVQGQGRTLQTTARALGCTPGTLGRWLREARPDTADTLIQGIYAHTGLGWAGAGQWRPVDHGSIIAPNPVGGSLHE